MKERALYIALVAVIAFGVLSQGFASIRVAEAVARADVADSVADVSLAIADSLARESSALRFRADSLADRYTVDSVRWSTRDAENRARIASLTRRASDTGQALEERLDTVGTRLFAEYRAVTDSIISAQAETIDDLQAERALLWARIETSDELLTGLTAEVEATRGANRALRSSNDALRAALSARTRESRLLKIGGAVLVGLAIYDGVRR